MRRLKGRNCWKKENKELSMSNNVRWATAQDHENDKSTKTLALKENVLERISSLKRVCLSNITNVKHLIFMVNTYNVCARDLSHMITPLSL